MSKKPRLSINKLAEYMNADVIRRRQIIKDAKYQKPFKTTRYSVAREAIKAYITNGYDESVIEKAIKRLESVRPETPFQQDDTINSILALESFQYIDLPDLNECSINNFSEDNTLVNLSGLDISVFPDLTINDKTNSPGGGIKIHIVKSHDLSGDSLDYVALMLKYFFLNKGMDKKSIDDKLCIAIDVFGAKCSVAPKAYKRAVSRISVACSEIVSNWDSI